jgi:hypothetical protein
VATRKLDEERRQALVVVVTAAAIGLALVAVLAGLAYDQLWVPSRPVASVGSANLSRTNYWAERKNAFAREVVQNFQLLALFGGNPQFTQQFQGQSPVVNQRVETVRRDPVDDAVVGQWETRQIKQQGAAGREISVTPDEINQAAVADLGQIFLPPPIPPVTTTATVAPTADPAATAAVTPTATLESTPGGSTATPEATATLEATATPEATATLEPTETPRPTPAAAEASSQFEQIIDEVYRRFEIELAAVGAEAQLTKDDFRAALTDQYQEQVINTKVQAQLVPEAGFVFSSEAERVTARQVLVAVTPPENATQEQLDAIFAETKGAADAIVAELRGGADFATVAAASSDDPGSKELGGDLGSFDKNGVAQNTATYPPELVSAAFALAPNTLSDPVRTQFGWHVIEVTSRDVPDEEAQLREARTKALDTWIEEQRTALAVQRFPEPTPTATTPPETPSPTIVPTFLPGPPTPAPTDTPAPVETPATAAPTATATTTP